MSASEWFSAVIAALLLNLFYWFGYLKGRRNGYAAGILDECKRQRIAIEQSTRNQQNLVDFDLGSDL